MKNISIIILTLFIFSCTNETIRNPGFVNAIVDSTKHVNWNGGIYKLQVYYSFIINDEKITGMDDQTKERLYTRMYDIGDSVLIKFDKKNINNNKLIKLVYKKRKIQFPN